MNPIGSSASIAALASLGTCAGKAPPPARPREAWWATRSGAGPASTMKNGTRGRRFRFLMREAAYSGATSTLSAAYSFKRL